MKRILLIGGSGRGKSKFAKDYIIDIPKENLLINDVNNEYGGLYYSKKDFLEKAKKAQNKIILFEEATIFFKGRSTEEMIEILVRARHTNNTIILVFHSLRSVPADIFDLIDCIVLFATGERPDLVKLKYQDFPEIYDAYNDLNERENNVKPHLHEGKHGQCLCLHEYEMIQK